MANVKISELPLVSTFDGDALLPIVAGGVTKRVKASTLIGVINVKWFGAVGDGVTDDSTAILSCVNAAAALSAGAHSSRASVYFPPGIYLLSSSAALTETNATSIAAGIHFYGAGMYASILRLNPSGSDLYFYNNAASPREQFCSFEDLGFEGLAPASLSAYTDISNNAKGFRLWATTATGSHEQGFRFTRCRFFGLHTMFETAGNNTTSENSFVQCKISHIKSVVLSLNNLQSFNHSFHATDIEAIYGDVFVIGTLGGGAIKMYGGSVILFSDTAADTYFFKATGSSGTNGFPFSFSGVRFEFRGNTANFASISDAVIQDVHVNDSFMLTTATSNLANFCKVARAGQIMFNGCSFNEGSTGLYQFHDTAAVGGYANGLISFERCGLPIDWSDRCFLDNRYGHIRAVDCYGTNTGVITTPRHYAHDFDLRGDETAGGVATWSGADAIARKDAGNGTGQGWRLKTAQIKMGSEFWPDTTEQGLRLPKNAIMKSLHLRKPALGADSTSVTFRIGRADKSGTDHLVSNTDQMKNTHTGDTTNYFYCVGTTDNERNILLYTNENPVQGIVGGICIVEYY